jgi:hypothetical protein
MPKFLGFSKSYRYNNRYFDFPTVGENVFHCGGRGCGSL